MKAVILSAGYGTRMGDLTHKLPKPMLVVNGKPLLWHQIQWLKSEGIEEFFINLYYLPQSVIEYFGDGSKFGVKITYSIEKELMGTGGAYWAFRDKLGKNFLAINCDVLLKMNIGKFYQFHKKHNFMASMALQGNQGAHSYSPVWINQNKVVQIGGTRVTDSPTIFTGCQILSNVIFDYLPQGPSSIMEAFYKKVLSYGRVGAYTGVESWIDLGTKELYDQYRRSLNDEMKRGENKD